MPGKTVSIYKANDSKYLNAKRKSEAIEAQTRRLKKEMKEFDKLFNEYNQMKAATTLVMLKNNSLL